VGAREEVACPVRVAGGRRGEEGGDVGRGSAGWSGGSRGRGCRPTRTNFGQPQAAEEADDLGPRFGGFGRREELDGEVEDVGSPEEVCDVLGRFAEVFWWDYRAVRRSGVCGGRLGGERRRMLVRVLDGLWVAAEPFDG
jgi:hypothetical protein